MEMMLGDNSMLQHAAPSAGFGELFSGHRFEWKRTSKEVEVSVQLKDRDLERTDDLRAQLTKEAVSLAVLFANTPPAPEAWFLSLARPSFCMEPLASRHPPVSPSRFDGCLPTLLVPASSPPPPPPHACCPSPPPLDPPSDPALSTADLRRPNTIEAHWQDLNKITLLQVSALGPDPDVGALRRHLADTSPWERHLDPSQLRIQCNSSELCDTDRLSVLNELNALSASTPMVRVMEHGGLLAGGKKPARASGPPSPSLTRNRDSGVDPQTQPTIPSAQQSKRRKSSAPATPPEPPAPPVQPPALPSAPPAVVAPPPPELEAPLDATAALVAAIGRISGKAKATELHFTALTDATLATNVECAPLTADSDLGTIEVACKALGRALGALNHVQMKPATQEKRTVLKGELDFPSPQLKEAFRAHLRKEAAQAGGGQVEMAVEAELAARRVFIVGLLIQPAAAPAHVKQKDLFRRICGAFPNAWVASCDALLKTANEALEETDAGKHREIPKAVVDKWQAALLAAHGEGCAFKKQTKIRSDGARICGSHIYKFQLSGTAASSLNLAPLVAQ